jgi:excinuclease ABC subunit A
VPNSSLGESSCTAAASGLVQVRGASNARSSVGSVTTLPSLVRMVYSRAGAYPANQSMLYA